MYSSIYFDLDDTLVKDNLETGKSELLQSGYDEYVRLKNLYPVIPFRLLTNRLKNQISFPQEYTFDEVIGKEDSDLFILEKLHSIPWVVFLNPLNIYIYLNAMSLYRRGETSKALYLFLRHVCEGEKILMIDDDRRVSLLFRW
ncbi:MAG: hypothetical protein UR61_C0024G0009 [candidate division WS6 bacterium GW2011_GWE1_34_7]|uniref:Uncharacterized protein n=1 Tax=candidate division WS6 bacterium GW2011_GWE1_34_7 TaxID=1619093 RepID=A0A0G0B7V4_9BACT|nr:MAG: hypothetical protein UR61_C0024G0009 [candidate division WS6 bacterium GW2011_GWE1_34_7]